MLAEEEFILTEDTFLKYCFKHYDNSSCLNFAEFEEDLQRIKYIKKLFTRYENSGELKERLILNHIIILNNVFGPDHTARILFFRVSSKHWPLLKPFLILLNILPRQLTRLRKTPILTDEITMDPKIIDILRKL